jgi:anti-sigma factor RsiW
MMEAPPSGRPTDADLIAFLDGELAAERRDWMSSWLARDNELRARSTLLASGERPFRDAFEPLLAEAPRARLQNMLAGLPGYRPWAVVETRVAERRPLWARAWPRLALIAAGISLFLAGAVTHRMLPTLREAVGIEIADESEDDWRQAAAEYLSLYTPETLASIPDDAVPREHELAVVGTRLGITLPLAEVSLPGLALKRAQLLQYDGKPIGQIAYLDPRDGAVALCIYANDHPDTAQTTEQRAGMNIVHWSSRGRAFMLVGHTAMPQLQNFALLLSQRLTL